jgi:cytoskeletal protein CcmA (bactofilin family)
MGIISHTMDDQPLVHLAATPTADEADFGVPVFLPRPKNAPPAVVAPKATALPTLPNLGLRPGEQRTLVLGPGITLQGIVMSADRLVIEGTLDAGKVRATELLVAQSGTFKGEAEVETAEIAGTLDGSITTRGSLLLRSTGKIIGTARCRWLSVELGGQVSGWVEMLTEPAKPVATLTRAPAPSVAARILPSRT